MLRLDHRRIVIGHDPGVVLVPTFQVHDTRPDESEVFPPKPAAVDGPDLYSTVILYSVFGFPLIAIVAFLP